MIEPAIVRTPKRSKSTIEEASEADRGVEDNPYYADDSRFGDSGGGCFEPNFMQGDVRGSMADSSPSPEKGRQGDNRRQSSSQQSSSRRHHYGRQLSLQTHLPPPQSSRNAMGSPVFQRSTHSPQGSHNRHYTMPGQPPVGMSHSPQSFPYSQPCTHAGGADAGMIPQNIHPTYQPMLPAAVYSCQRSSPEESVLVTPPVFPYQANPPAPPVSPRSSPPSSPIRLHYSGSGQFHSLRYQPPLPSQPFGFPPQPYVPSPLYQSQYAPVHYQPPPETEGQGTWWFVPHGSSLPGRAANPPYQGHFPGNHQETGVVQQHTAASSLVYPMSPSRHRRDLDDMRHLPSVNVSPSSPTLGSSSSSGAPFEWPAVRRSYHPKPPANRSEWVMWVGNVPSDASHDELWRFFISVPGKPSDNSAPIGITSIFLILRSNCAFVNFEDEADLTLAITRFNGQPLRPNDPRCPRLLCRTRKKDDDLKAGVGGQRGMGMHTKWVKEKKGKMRSDVSAEQSDGDDPSYLASKSSGRLSYDSHVESRPALSNKYSSGSGSFASTDSSMLTRYFPNRYFILKSLNQYDLDLSVQEGLWATQRHNEGILDQAYRTSKEVYLIFGVNKSGEFYGYGKMAGPVRQGGQRVSWAQRTDSHSPFTDHLVEESPMPITTPDFGTPGRHAPAQSAPAEMGEQHQRMSLLAQGTKFSLDQPRAGPVNLSRHASSQERTKPAEFHLDENAPILALKNPDSRQSVECFAGLSPGSVAEQQPKAGTPVSGEAEATKVLDSWGEPFRIEWLSTERLLFYRCRHIRNPWNHDREVKVSRDGTELEPSVGKMLIEEWENNDGKQAVSVVAPDVGTTRSGKSSGGGGGAVSESGGNRRSATTKSLQPARDPRETSSS